MIVTGGARGIGAAVVEEFADSGAIVASVDVNPLDIRRDGVVDFQADVANEAHIVSTISEIAHLFGRVDVLVNNAGIERVGATESIEMTTCDAVVATHLRGISSAVGP